MYTLDEHVKSQLERIFLSNFFHDQRWTIAEPSLARDGRHVIDMTIDAPLGLP